jgi:hypothetical protein
VDLLSLLSGGDLSGANSPINRRQICGETYLYRSKWGKFIPDGLVGNDDLVPLLCAQLLGDSVKLAGDNLDGLVGLTLLHKNSGVSGMYSENI